MGACACVCVCVGGCLLLGKERVHNKTGPHTQRTCVLLQLRESEQECVCVRERVREKERMWTL